MLSIKFRCDSMLKLFPTDSTLLGAQQVIPQKKGIVLPVRSFSVPGKHLSLSLPLEANIGSNFPHWYVFGEHVEVIRPKPQTINEHGLKLLKQSEGLRLNAYQDAVGVWTIGYGTTANVRPGMVVTQAEAEALLRKDLAKFEKAVQQLVTTPLTDNEFSALVCFVYNVGEGAFAGSTMRRFLNSWEHPAAAKEFARWDKAGGRSLPGLTERRKQERRLFLGELP